MESAAAGGAGDRMEKSTTAARAIRTGCGDRAVGDVGTDQYKIAPLPAAGVSVSRISHGGHADSRGTWKNHGPDEQAIRAGRLCVGRSRRGHWTGTMDCH